MKEKLQLLSLVYNENPQSQAIPLLLKNISLMLLPSAPFSLAAKSSLQAFIPSNPPLEALIRTIIQKVEQRVERLTIDWNNA